MTDEQKEIEMLKKDFEFAGDEANHLRKEIARLVKMNESLIAENADLRAALRE